jgi:hypothetical protein
MSRATVLASAFLLFWGPLPYHAPSPAQGQADDAQVIFNNMKYLEPLVGNWNAVMRFHGRDGSTREETATFRISWALDNTYLKQEITRPRQSILVFITYNPVRAKYDSTYFYSRWALRVTETGEYDDKSKEFRTTAFIPLEDGTRDENVRTITKLAKTGEIEYLHYSRYNNESTEVMDLDIKMTPMH